jgi:dipeptidase E
MIKKLALYCDQEISENRVIDERWLELIGKAKPVIGYVPSAHDPEKFYFNKKRDYYADLGASLEPYFELDNAFNEKDLPKLLSCDAIHLSGGNTFYFLHWLRKRKMLEVLKNYVAKGGILIGVSAGAILMTPDISTSTLCGDEEPNEPMDTSALALVDFLFLPHYEPEMSKGAATLQRKLKLPIYACPDGSGMIVNGQNIELFGNAERLAS